MVLTLIAVLGLAPHPAAAVPAAPSALVRASGAMLADTLRRRPPACVGGRTALVLSGGGAKGLAHIGLLRALDSLGVRPDLVVGSSMGAIVGAMYASGLDGRTIDSLARQVPLDRVLNTFEPRAPRELGRLQPLVTWEEGSRGIGIQTTAVREEVVNAISSALLLRGNLLARGDFDRLPTPFRAVTTDLRDRSTVILRGGDLAEAVRASFAIPLLFRPVEIGTHVLADGGLSANIPIAAARHEGATRVLVSDVSERVAPDSADLQAVVGIADRLINFLFLQPLDSLGADDLYLRTPLPKTPSLDFAPAQVAHIIAAGRVVADSLLATAPCLPYGERRRVPLPLRVGAIPASEAEIARLLALRAGDTLSVTVLGQRLALFERDTRYRSVWLRPVAESDSVVGFAPRVLRAPRRSGNLGFTYDSDLGGRAWIGMLDRNVLHTGSVGAVVGTFGELQRELRLSLRHPIGAGRLAPGPLAIARGFDEDIRLYDTTGTLVGEQSVRDGSLLLGVELPIDAGWAVHAGLMGRWWRGPSGNSDALGLLARVERFSGFAESQVTAELQLTAAYRRALIDARWRLQWGGVRAVPRVRAVLGDSVPLQLTPPLGGLEEGFPGLRFGERRGNREAMAGLALDRRMLGPLYLRLEGAVGRSATGGGLLAKSGWLGGVRGGLGLETVLGPIRAEYGVTSAGQTAFFLRFARWIPQAE